MADISGVAGMSARGGSRPSLSSATFAVARKELRDGFRDRQTTLYAIILPIALYPVLFWLMIQGWLFVQGRQEHTEVHLGVAAAQGAHVPDGLTKALATRPPKVPRDGESTEAAAKSNRAREDLERMRVERADRPLDEQEARAWLEPDSIDGTRNERTPDAVLYLRAERADADTIASDGGDARLFYDSTQSRSGIAKKRVDQRLPKFVDKLRADRAAELARTPADLEPFEYAPAKDIAPEKDRGAYILSFILPMVLVVMTVMGAFYPAVDLTAGERERNTAETTLLLPIPRLAIHQGKILAVSAAAVLATSLNLLALGLSAGHLLNMLREGRSIQIDLPLQAFAAIAPLALLFAFFVSAVLTGIASLARTFKEGQALLGPVQILFMFPAMAGAVPGLELTPTLACVPVINVVLAFRSLLKGESLPLEYSITAASLLVFALIAIRIAVHLLSREAIEGSSKSFKLGHLLRVFRSAGGTR
jgi:ABC-type Na+ efflux pump permease subunit